MTLWLHLMQCDSSINEACELLGSFEMIEEVIHSAFGESRHNLVVWLLIQAPALIVRFAEQRIDGLMDSALLDYSHRDADFDSIKFESEWNFFLPFSGKKKVTPAATRSASPLRNAPPASPGLD